MVNYKWVDAEAAQEIARLAICLTNEIMERTGVQHFEVDQQRLQALCRQFIEQDKYAVIGAFDRDCIVAFGAICQSYSLYAEGCFGIVQEFYVLPAYRSRSVGSKLLEQIVEYAKSRQWRRLELCTPPLPEFDRTLSFYQANGFEITGGRKMKRLIE